MANVSLVVLLLVIVPGFIADSAYRAVLGGRPLSDAERTLRSLILSVMGLAAYLLSGALAGAIIGMCPQCHLELPPILRAPPYVTGLSQTPSNAAIGLDVQSVLGLTLHILWTLAVAALWGRIVSLATTRRLFRRVAGRSLGVSGVWAVFWNDFFPGPVARHGEDVRTVSVELADGRLILGAFQSVTDIAEEGRDIILGNPYFYNAERSLFRAEGIRYMYIPEKEIRTVRLSGAGSEEPPRGYFNAKLEPAESADAAASKTTGG